jgi:hypothetical protein
MRKRTRIAVVTAALLAGLVVPAGLQGQAHAAGTAGSRQLVSAAPVNGQAITRWLQGFLPTTGHTRVGKTAALPELQWWKMAKVACKANELHDTVYEWQIDQLLWGVESQVPGVYRYRNPILRLSWELSELRERGGWVSELSAEGLCAHVDWRLARLK